MVIVEAYKWYMPRIGSSPGHCNLNEMHQHLLVIDTSHHARCNRNLSLNGYYNTENAPPCVNCIRYFLSDLKKWMDLFMITVRAFLNEQWPALVNALITFQQELEAIEEGKQNE